jgi:enoyl-CoA hydratase
MLRGYRAAMTLTPGLATLSASENHLEVGWHEPGIAEVVLANPQQRNAMSEPMTAAWSAAMTELAGLPGLRAVLVRAQGTAFCAGGDLSWIGGNGASTVPQISARMDAFYRAWLAVVDVPVPTIAYINGPAVGAGAAVALACDIRWVGPRARFSVPFTRLGLHAGMGTTYLLPEVVGPAMARDLLLTSRSLDCDGMLSCGLATARLDPEDVMSQVRQIAVNAPVAMRLTKRGLGCARSLDEALRWEGVVQPVTMTTADLQEGLAAARERREPAFEGR